MSKNITKRVVSVKSLVMDFFRDEDDFYSYRDYIQKKLITGGNFSATDLFEQSGYIPSNILTLPFLYDEEEEFTLDECALEDVEIRKQSFVEICLHDIKIILDNNLDKNVAIFGALYRKESFSEGQINFTDELREGLKGLKTDEDKMDYLEKTLQYWEFFIINEEDVEKLKVSHNKLKNGL